MIVPNSIISETPDDCQITRVRPRLSSELNCILFCFLTVIMTINIVLVNQSRNINYNDSSKDSQSSMYSASTAVFIVEFAKLTLNIVLLFLCEKSWNKSWKIIKVEFVQNWLETIKCSIPALLYVVQNNLSYIALTYLDPGTFEVTLQIKLLTTAIVMRLLMGKILKVSQWGAILLLLMGICLAESSEITNSASINDSIMPMHVIEKQNLTKLSSISENDDNPPKRVGEAKFLIGFFATVAMTFTSALAGVYFEKLLKHGKMSKNCQKMLNRHEQTKNSQKSYARFYYSREISSLWVKNLQMFLFSVPISLIGCFTQDSSEIQQLGFFHGYDSRVWLIVFISSVGGLATSVTLKYLDNIYKNFSSSFAIILASLSSIYLSGKQYGCFFFFGSALVCVSLCFYYKNDNSPKNETMIAYNSPLLKKSFLKNTKSLNI